MTAYGFVRAQFAPLSLLAITLFAIQSAQAAVFNPAPGAVDGAAGSLRAAIITANGNAQPDTINLAAGTYSLTIANTAGQENAAAEGDLDITEIGQTLTIQGAGSDMTFISQSVMDRVFHLIGNATLEVFDVTIIDGTAVDNGAAGSMPGLGDGNGGGILNDGGTLTIRATTIEQCAALGDSADEGGGGIYQVSGALTLGNMGGVETQIRNNQATGVSGSGGGLFFADGTLTAGSMRFVGNSANRAGGGVEIVNGTVNYGGNTRIIGNDVNGTAGTPNPGNGGGLHITGNSATVSFNNTIVSGNVAANEGGGYWNQSGSTLNLTAAQTVNNTAHGRGGGGVFNNGGIVNLLTGAGPATLVNNTASGNSGDGEGGGLLSLGGMVTVTGVGNQRININGNNAGGQGGGVLVTGTLNMSIVQVVNNHSDSFGGGIVGGGATLTLTDVQIRDNTSDVAGAGIFNSGSSITVQGGSLIDGNIATGAGGGVSQQGAAAVLTVDNSTVSNNSSGFVGGGLEAVGGMLMVQNGTVINGNQSNSAGGGINIQDGATLTVDGSLISVNISGDSAGGINIKDSALVTSATVSNSTISGNSSTFDGGGIYVGSMGSLTINGGSSVDSNIASRNGGGLFINAAASTVSIADTQITGNTASGDSADQGGGGIFNDGASLIIPATVPISGNMATGISGSGGGIFNDTGGVLNIAGTTISGNSAIRAGGGIEDNSGAGQGVILNGTSLLMNSAGANPGNGGGLHVTGAGEVSITSGTISNNSAGSEGGGLWNGGGIMTIDGVLIDGNSASGDGSDNGGGGIFNAGGIVIAIGPTQITNNQANGTSGSGGGIFNDLGGTLSLTGSLLSGNSASRAGGGIEDNSGAGLGLILNGPILDGNSAGPNPGNGGGLHVTGAGDVTYDNGLVLNNTASSEGGGLWNGTGTMTVDSVILDSNTASGASADNGGGGIFNAGGAVSVIDGSLVINNQADGVSGSGGGIFNDAGGSLTVNDSTISGNSASRAGGGIEDNAGSGVGVQLTNVTLNLNDASTNPGNGGGLHVTGASDVVIIGGTVSGNTAANEGGGLWNDNGNMTIDAVIIDGNTASGVAAGNGGGGLFNDGGFVDITGGQITNNLTPGAASNGGGAHVEGGSLATEMVQITGNDKQGVFASNGAAVALQDTVATGNGAQGLDTNGASDVVISGGNFEGIQTRATSAVDTFDVILASGLVDIEASAMDLNSGGLIGGASLVLSPTNFAVFDGSTVSDYTGTTQLTSGQTQVNGLIGSSGGTVSVDSAAILGGIGQINRTVVVDGTVDPGMVGLGSRDVAGQPSQGDDSELRAPGQFMISDLRMNTGSTLQMELNGLVAGGSYDQMQVTDLDLDNDTSGGATLSLTVGFTPALGDQFTIIDVTSGNPVLGTFNGHAEGDLIEGDGFYFTISYVGGDGNDVVLTNAIPTIFVDANSMNRGGPPGTTWATAFNSLQDGLAAAAPGSQVWVAQGVYYPDEGIGQINDDPTSTFNLTDTVNVYGGFNGTETLLSERDPETNLTILSGDIDGDDINVDLNFIAETVADIQGQNAHHVLTLAAATTDLTLDGFTVTAGNALGGAVTRGGGLLCLGADQIELLQMHFIGNRANRGGAYSICRGMVRDSSFINNVVDSVGGVYDGEGGDFDRVLFQGNQAGGQGGAMYLGSTPLNVRRSAFIGNSTDGPGGAIRIVGPVTLNDVLFRGNAAGGGNNGGAMFVGGNGNVSLTNVTMSGNSSGDLGGALRIDSPGMHDIENTIVWNNEDSSGVGNLSSSIHIPNGTTLVSNSLIQGSGGSGSWNPMAGTDGGGNLDEDPLFVTDSDPTTAPTLAGDAHLIDGTNAENAGDNSFVTSATDLDGEHRIQYGTVDMGAYEGAIRLFEDSFEELDMN